MDHLATILIDGELDLEEDNQSMCAFISRSHGVFLAACAEREEMVESLSQFELYSHSLEHQVASLRKQVNELLLDLERSQEQMGRC